MQPSPRAETSRPPPRVRVFNVRISVGLFSVGSWSFPWREVCRGGQVGLRLEAADTVLEDVDGGLQSLRSEHDAQRGWFLVRAGDDGGGHPGGITGGEPIGGVEHGQETVRRGAVVGGQEVGDLDAAIAELSASAAWLDDG